MATDTLESKVSAREITYYFAKDGGEIVDAKALRGGGAEALAYRDEHHPDLKVLLTVGTDGDLVFVPKLKAEQLQGLAVVEPKTRDYGPVIVVDAGENLIAEFAHRDWAPKVAQSYETALALAHTLAGGLPPVEAEAGLADPALPDLDDPSTLSGQITTGILDVVRGLPREWTKCSGFQQSQLIDQAARLARHVIREAVRNVARVGQDWDTVDIKVGDFKTKQAAQQIKGEFATPLNDAALHAIARGGEAILVFASPEAFHGTRREEKAQPDQEDLFTGEDADPGVDEPQARWLYDFQKRTRTHPETGEVEEIEDGVTAETLREAGVAFEEAAEGGIPAEEAERKLEDAKTAAAEKRSRTEADAEARGRDACDQGKDRSCPRSSSKYREAWLRGYDARGVELARDAIKEGADAGHVTRRMREVGIAVPAGFPDDLSDEPAMPAAPLAPAEAA